MSQLTQNVSYATMTSREPVLQPPASSRFNGKNALKSDKLHSAMKQPDGSNEVRGRRRNAGIIGTRKGNVSTNIKSANRRLDVYVGNLDSSSTCESISEYVSNDNDIKVFDCIELTSNQYFKSFKLTVSSNDRDKLLVSDLWPEGIICRKFYSKNKQSTKNN